MTSSWQEEYIDSLNECNKHENLDYELIDAYTRLADQTAALEAAKATNTPINIRFPAPRDSSLPPPPADTVGQLKFDLAEALRSRGQCQSRLKAAENELDKLKQRNKVDTKLNKELYTERAVLQLKVRDRDEELKGKAKLLEDVQDEMLSLNLQLNMAEQRCKKLEGDNKDLVDRWMARMGQEADALNNASKFT